MSLTVAEEQLAAAIGFELGVCDLIKRHSGGPLSRLTAVNATLDPRDADSVAVAVKRDQVMSVIATLQPLLLPRGYRVFWSEIWALDSHIRQDALAALKTTDDFEIVRLRRPCGGNYGVLATDVFQRLERWRTRCEFEVVGAGGAWVAIEFATLPQNVCEFAEEVYDFCPDTVEQGVGLLNEANDPEVFEAARRLCPKLSENMERKLKEKGARIESMMNARPELRDMFGAAGFNTPTDMGIKLLAHQLTESHQLFLWWD